MAGNHDDDDDKSDHRPDIWIESQKLLKTSLNVQREHGYLYGYSTLVFIGSHFGVSFFFCFLFQVMKKFFVLFCFVIKNYYFRVKVQL